VYRIRKLKERPRPNERVAEANKEKVTAVRMGTSKMLLPIYHKQRGSGHRRQKEQETL
jgi:hypothetical protein